MPDYFQSLLIRGHSFRLQDIYLPPENMISSAQAPPRDMQYSKISGGYFMRHFLLCQPAF